MVSREIRNVLDALGKTVSVSVRQLQLRAFQALTSATPVDTGFARAGWSPSVGAPDPGPEDRPSDPQVASAQASALFAAHAAAAQAIARSGANLRGQPVFLVNPVRYLEFLNQGTSAQAPAMFVERALATALIATQRDLSRRIPT